jgi:hypothetical protein
VRRVVLTQRFIDKLSVLRSIDSACADLIEEVLKREPEFLAPTEDQARADLRSIEVRDLYYQPIAWLSVLIKIDSVTFFDLQTTDPLKF